MESNGSAGPKPSKVEGIKLASQYLKTLVADELDNGTTHFTEDAATVLKFHGTYQQDDRDHRTLLKREGKEKAFSFMVRIRIVGGKLTAEQYLASAKLAETVGNGTLRITTRQEFQLHGVLKTDLASTMRTINESLMTTLAACGDVERNVLCCPAPIADHVRDAMQADADRFAEHCSPRSSTYWEIWVDGEKIVNPDVAPAGRSRCRPPTTTPSSRSTAKPIFRASLKRPSPSPKTTAPTSTPTIWATSPSLRPAS